MDPQARLGLAPQWFLYVEKLLFLSDLSVFSLVFLDFPRFLHSFGHLSESSWSILVVLDWFWCGSVEEKAALMATVKRLKVILDNSATKDRDQVGSFPLVTPRFLFSAPVQLPFGYGSKLFTRKMDGVMPEKSNFQGELVLAP
jgi:hypothetical protein